MKIVLVFSFEYDDFRISDPGIVPQVGHTIYHRYYTYRIVNLNHHFDLDSDTQTIHMQTEIVR